MSAPSGAGRHGGLPSRVGAALRLAWAALRRGWRATLHLWRRSLGFRVVVITMLLGVLVLTAVGNYLYGSIAQGLVDSRERIASEDSQRDAADAQSRFDSTDQIDTQAKLTQFATTLIQTYRRDSANEPRYVVLTRFEDSTAPVIVGPLESGAWGCASSPRSCGPRWSPSPTASTCR